VLDWLIHLENGAILRSILIVEDDVKLGPALLRGIEAEGYDVVLVDNGVDALIAVANRQFSATVVDVMLPAMSGFEITRRIRDTGSTLPVLLLTARDAVDDRVTGLDAGADDYLTKPFSFAELAARLRALLRRDPSELWVKVTGGDVTLDSQTRKGFVDGRMIALSPIEFVFLRTLLVAEKRPVTRADILDTVWGGGENIDPNVVDQYVSALRKKLLAASSRVSIATVRMVGYRVEWDE
jgi:two-component system OmpR family response regulator